MDSNNRTIEHNNLKILEQKYPNITQYKTKFYKEIKILKIFEKIKRYLLKNLSRDLVNKIQEFSGFKIDDEFIFQTDNQIHTRQYIHILANLNRYNSQTIMDKNFKFVGDLVKCSECHYLMITGEYHEFSCCYSCDCFCPNFCENGFEEDTGNVWNGNILVSKRHLKLGRRKRRRRNQWRYGQLVLN